MMHISFFLFFAVGITVTDATVIRLDMTKTDSLMEQMKREGKWANWLREYQENMGTTNNLIGSTNLSSYLDNIYVCNITIGTPPQRLQVMPNTASSTFWVISSNCTTKGCKGLPDYRKKNMFNASKSSTFRGDGREFMVPYGSTYVRGVLGVDVVDIGGVKYDSQIFGLSTTVSQQILRQPIDGMLGLGWESIAQYRIPPPFFSIAPQLDKKVFTLWLKRTIKPTMRSYGGQLTLGGFDHQHCEKDISYVTLAAQTWWIFPLDGFKLGSVEVFHRRLAITCSGASYIGVPFVYVNKIVNVLKAKRGFPPPIDCSRMHNSPNFTFSINGREYSIPSFEYIINVGDRFEDKCVVGIFSMEAPGFGPSWVLGDPFLRTFCNIHDVENARLGFAVAKQSKSEKSVIY